MLFNSHSLKGLQRLFSILCLFAPIQPLAGQREIRLSVGSAYFTGHFQQEDKTNILYLPVSLKYRQFPWITRVTVPYLMMNGNTVIDLVGDSESDTSSRRAEGLGDIILTQTYQYAPSIVQDSVLNLSVKVKFPTASAKKGLGTGKYDFSFQGRFIKRIGRHSPFLTLGYQFVGKVDDVQLNNRFYTTVGESYQVHAQFSAGMMYQYKQASSNRRVSDQKIVGFCSWKLTPDGRWLIDAYSLVGLTVSSPEYGGGLSISYTYK